MAEPSTVEGTEIERLSWKSRPLIVLATTIVAVVGGDLGTTVAMVNGLDHSVSEARSEVRSVKETAESALAEHAKTSIQLARASVQLEQVAESLESLAVSWAETARASNANTERVAKLEAQVEMLLSEIRALKRN